VARCGSVWLRAPCVTFNPLVESGRRERPRCEVPSRICDRGRRTCNARPGGARSHQMWRCQLRRPIGRPSPTSTRHCRGRTSKPRVPHCAAYWGISRCFRVGANWRPALRSTGERCSVTRQTYYWLVAGARFQNIRRRRALKRAA